MTKRQRELYSLFWFIILTTVFTTTATKSSSFSIQQQQQHGSRISGNGGGDDNSKTYHGSRSSSSSHSRRQSLTLSSSLHATSIPSSDSVSTDTEITNKHGNDEKRNEDSHPLDCGCDLRSNTTHIVWKTTTTTTTTAEGRTATSSSPPPRGSCHCHSIVVQTRREAEQHCLKFLRDNLMPFDIPFQETLGFPPVSYDFDDNVDSDRDQLQVDGLDYGLIGPTIRLSLDAKIMYPWTDDLPKHIFFDYVLNYANLNEARTNWRPLLIDALRFNESDLYRSGNANVSSVTDWVNKNIWKRLGKPTTVSKGGNDDGDICTTEIKPIFFKSGQTPLIFDPMSTIGYGYASCTGISILFCNALRAVGIPARVVGTPAWYGNRTNGNHNWVEVYVGTDNEDDSHGNNDVADEDLWKFLEGLPANPNDSLNGDPCQRWFCDTSRYPSSKVYAAKMSRCPDPRSDDDIQQQYGRPNAPHHLRSTNLTTASTTSAIENIDMNESSLYFPLAWEWQCFDVPAVDRTDYYAKICQKCSDDVDDATE